MAGQLRRGPAQHSWSSGGTTQEKTTNQLPRSVRTRLLEPFDDSQQLSFVNCLGTCVSAQKRLVPTLKEMKNRPSVSATMCARETICAASGSAPKRKNPFVFRTLYVGWIGGVDGCVRSLRTPRIMWGGSWRKASPHQALSPLEVDGLSDDTRGLGRRELGALVGSRRFLFR